ncbi:MAG: site-specific DNA-methyltransferase [Anaerolineaceae bacterium]|nr:site-specific DNA-methyltransferase [Anaerolineaceae bacterium]
MNCIYFGDNLPILKKLPDESVDLIYIDPPFNTGKIQSRKTIKTIRSENGDRKGFQGNRYQTVELGTTEYQDSFDFDIDGVVPREVEKSYNQIAPHGSVYFLEGFLRPRLIEAKRILKTHGSLYFHIDYREVHYCKILLDHIFGRESFINEIIWAYDFGGRAKSRWPAKHDNILFYVKDPTNYIFNTNEIDRERYMAPGLVGPEKAEKGKLPTDTWFWPYVGMRNTDTWWQSIVGTNSKERVGYPTQKPRRLMDRIIRASTHPGSVVMDFFAGSGTIGESCLDLRREFILIDDNPASMEVMAMRFAGIPGIQWNGFDPTPFLPGSSSIIQKRERQEEEKIPEITPGFQLLVSTASYLQKHLEEINDLWKNSPFEWVLQLPARKKGKLGRQLITSLCASQGLYPERSGDSSEALIFNGYRYAIKFSTLWTNGNYQFQQIRSSGYDYLLCLGISPFEAQSWVIKRELAIEHAKPQHKGANGAEYWLSINPKAIPEWAIDCGGSLEQTVELLKSQKKS